MTQRIPQSTAFTAVFKAYLATDHVTEATSKTIAITISKNGGAFGNLNAGATNATEISSGWYKVALDTTDTGTLGPLAIRGAVATIDDVGILLEVVSATSGGYTNLDAAVSGRMATYTQPTGFLSATFPAGTVANTTNITAGTITTVTNLTNAPTSGDLTSTMKTSVTTAATAATPVAASVTGAVGSVTGNVGGNVTGSVGSVTGLTASNLDATISSRASAANLATLTGYVDTEITTLQTSVDDIPTNAELATALGTADDAVLAQVALVKAKSDLIPGTMDGKTYAETVRLMGSVLLGKASGLDTTTAVFRAVDDSKARVTATVDANGNRSAVTLDAS